MARPGSWLRFALGVLALVPAAMAAEPTRPVEYNRDVRPILAENCFHCHGPDKGTRKAGLRLDQQAAAVEKGAIVPGRAEESELVARILSADAEEVMPPPDSTKRLSPEQKDVLRRWVAEGAGYQAHWSYEPIRAPEPPATRDAAWPRNPVDRFILRDLEAKGVAPSPEADRATLIRRLSLDLIGLPPTLAEVAAFEGDEGPDAYEKLVDRLLASPHYGERMAVPWLDLVRFADTVGYHGDQNQNVFPYRDYVVDAFNANKPFDRFTTEQLAGDLLPDPTAEQRVATAFNRLNMVTREGGAQPREYLAKYAADRVRTVAITWLGSTMGCAECHDHKFDPFTAKDFYRMGAFFADVEQWGVYMDYVYSPNPDLRGFSNDHPFPPEMDVASPALLRRLGAIDARARAALAAGRERARSGAAGRRALAAFEAEARAFLAKHPDGWDTPAPALWGAKDPEKHVRVEPDRCVVLVDPPDSKRVVPLRLAVEPGWLAAIRLEVLPHPDHDGRIVVGTPKAVNIRVSPAIGKAGVDDRPPTIRLIARFDPTARAPVYANGHLDLNPAGAWRLPLADPTRPQSAVFVLDRPVRVEAGDSLVVSVRAEAAGCVRVSCSPFGFDDVESASIAPALAGAFAAPDGRTPEQADRVVDEFLRGTDFDPGLLAQLNRLALDRAECRDGQARVLVTRARPPLPTRVLPRGNWQDESGEVVTPGVPHFLPQPPEADSRRLDRLDLARWIVAPENPLTARVFANRTWKQFFGAGLAAVMEDVGAQGEWPSHPELLDWLAADFRDHGWDVKRLVRQLVTSATYRQSSKLRPELRDLDPGNRWLASQSPRRLDAEFVRDNALAVAGLLNPELGGPSVFPPQPGGYYAALQFPERDYVAQTDGRQHRRGLYSHWQRTFLHPMLANFDAPSREECIASRNQANTPQQALTLLNDPNFVEAAREFARSLLVEPAGDAARLDRAFRRALARPPRGREAASLGAFLDAQRAANRQDPGAARRLVGPPDGSPLDPVEWAAWTEVCRVVLNLHETITRY